MKLFFIVETFSCKSDINGNRYHCARITSTMTGRDLILRSLNDKNQARRIVNKYCEDRGRNGAMFEVNIEDMPKRVFKELDDNSAGVWSHLVTQMDLNELER